jgi:hypothetical protein
MSDRYRLRITPGKTLEAAVFFTLQSAYEAAQDLADRIDQAVTVVQEDTYPRGKSLLRTKKPRKKPAGRVTLPVETRQAPANKKRTKKKPGPTSKLHALSMLRNPVGHFYFNDPGTGATVWARTEREIRSKANRRARETGRKISVWRETIEGPARKGGARAR